MKFRATLEFHGKTVTGIQIPAEVVASLGFIKHARVRATINGYTYRGSVASMGGKFMLGMSADIRASTVLAAGMS